MKQVLLLLFLLPLALFSQTFIGKVIDRETGESVPFPAVVSSENTRILGDFNGLFTMNVTTFPVTLIVTASEYVSDTIVVNVAENLIIRLVSEASLRPAGELENTIVIASRRRQRVEEVPISLEIIKPDLINNKGITDLEQAVDQCPGAYTMDGQVSIRGGSGFAYGAGSRVLVLWNEIPLLSGDVGDVKWNAIPIESAQQVEVIKGASSVLYGSGALNGIISLIERELTQETYFMAKVQAGIYDNPKRQTLQWWEKGKNPTTQQADVSFGKQWKDLGLNLGAYGYTSDGYRQGETEDRGRINGTVYYKPAKYKQFRASLGWNAQYSKAGSFIIWQSDTFAYQPMGSADTSLASSTLSYTRGLRLSIDPSVRYFDKFGNKHQVKSRYYLTDNRNYTNASQSSKAEINYIDYQFQRNWNNNAWVLTAGTAFIDNNVKSYLVGDHRSRNFAVYTQGEKRWKKLHITAGVRFEYFEQDKRQGDSEYYIGKDSLKLPVIPIVRMGIHYEIAKYTHLRASFGQGVRYPSVAERYTSTAVGSLNVFPNPELKRETGWAAEFGVKQGVKIGNWKGFADGAVFVNHYNNMMEFTFGNYIPPNVTPSLDPANPGYVFNWLGFRAENAEEATISGLDLSLSGEGEIGKVKLQALMGYTYMNPVSNNRDSSYLATFSDSSSTLLKYRFRHLAKADVQATYKRFSLGGSLRMNSFMTNIDAIFEDGILGQQILPGLKRYRREHNGSAFVFDARIAYEFAKHLRVSFIVNNLANAEYSGRPGDIQPPRSFVFQLQYKL